MGKKILDLCSTGKHFGAEVQRYVGGWGEVFFVDQAVGSDGNTGEDWDGPLKTIEKALDLCSNYRNDVIFVRRSRVLTAAQSPVLIDVDRVHVIGVPVHPLYPEACSLYRGVATDEPAVEITAGWVEFAGFTVDALWTKAIRDATDALEGLKLNGDAGGLNYCHIHNCRFPGWYGKTGIAMWGSAYNLIEDCNFEGYATYAGLYEYSSPAHNCNYNKFRRIYGHNCKYVLETDIPSHTFQTIEDLWSLQTGTAAVRLGTGGNGYAGIKGLIGDVAKASLLSGVAACDTIANAWANYKTTVADAWGNDGPLVV